jgi:YbbR domain-containing protein
MTFEEVSDTEARVTLEGTARALDLLNEDEIVAGVDLSKLTAGAHLVEIRQKHLNLPVDISLSQVEPRFIRISARKKEADSSAREKE